MKTFISLSFVIIGFCSFALFKEKRKAPITLNEAVTLAEKFIKDNGYTKSRADTSKLSPELMDQFRGSLKKVLKTRRNTLHPKAFCYTENDTQFAIGFLSKSEKMRRMDSARKNSDLDGRSVIVMKDGSIVRMAHKDPLFSSWIKF